MDPVALGIILAVVVVVYFMYFRDSGPSGGGDHGIGVVGGSGATGGSGQVEEDPSWPLLTFVFGSQTGTAETFAEKLSDEGKQYQFRTRAIDVEEYNEEPDQLSEEEGVVIFLVATYGEGEPTDSMVDFYKWFKQEKPSLNGVRFTVFGLGNMQYENYNTMGKSMDELMQEYGGERVHELGLGNDDGTMEEDFLKWKTGMWQSVLAYYGRDAEVSDEAPEQQYEILIHDDGCDVTDPFKTERGAVTEKNPKHCNIVVNKELHTEKSDRSCVHVEIDISGSNIKYETGDHLGVWAENDPAIAAKLAKMLGYKMSTVFTLGKKGLVETVKSRKDVGAHPHMPPKISLRDALTKLCDIHCICSRSMLQMFAAHAKNPEDKVKLKNFAALSDESIAAYREYIQDAGRTIVEVLEDFPSAIPPLDHFLEVCPKLQCRYYSISSSNVVHPDKVHITVAHTQFTTSTGRTHNGVASTFLRYMKVGNAAPMFVRKSTFKLPSKSTPIIMVGPGTGYAPFRGFIQERRHQQATGETHMYFGCRERAKDFIYEDEFLEATRDGTLTDLQLAFSREGATKDYVQHRLMEQKEKIWDLLANQQAFFYVCGDATHMAKDVHKALHDIAIQVGGLSTSKAEEFVKNLETKGRYHKDVWT
eukprot:GFYU01001933.1.p1 GENE.GFYU01001933.1~~GFYU01001933.1.p1  ORF type:complete len:645 (-),score=228.47 GFYU01001933.1:109-2043(-)